MTSMNATPFSLKVKFRFTVKNSKTYKVASLMRVYGVKFSVLMRKVMNTKLSQMDYDDLPKLRQHISADTKVSDIALVITDSLPVETQRLVLDVTPVFDICPRDLKVFILLCLGIRSYRFLNTNSKVA